MEYFWKLAESENTIHTFCLSPQILNKALFFTLSRAHWKSQNWKQMLMQNFADGGGGGGGGGERGRTNEEYYGISDSPNWGLMKGKGFGWEIILRGEVRGGGGGGVGRLRGAF